MDHDAADQGDRIHRQIPPAFRRSSKRLSRVATARVSHAGRWLEDDQRPPRDYTELRDLGGSRDWRWAFPHAGMPDRREAYEHAFGVLGLREDWDHARLARVVAHDEAWYALRELLERRSPALWVGGDGPDHLRLLRRVRAVIPHFIVGDEQKNANILPMLLIVEEPDGKSTRHVLVDIASEKRSAAQQGFFDRLYEYLGSLDFDVYLLAGWWLRVDAFRVMAELLRTIGVLDEEFELKGEHLSRIEEYVCAGCRWPMVRRDVHAIDVVERHGEHLAVHHDCSHDVLDAAC